MIVHPNPLFAKGETAPPPPGGPIDPATLFVGGMQGAWWDPSDLSSMRQGDTAGSAAAVIDERVGYVGDKSGNGHHLVNGNVSQRPYLRSSGGLNWLEFDGADDFLVRVGGPGSVGDVYWACRAPSDSQYLMAYNDSGGGNLFGVVEAGNSSFTHLGCGTPSLFVNGVTVANSRAALLSAVGNVAALHELHGADLSGWSQLRIGLYGSGYDFSGQLFGAVLIEGQPPAARAGLRSWVGAKAGLTL